MDIAAEYMSRPNSDTRTRALLDIIAPIVDVSSHVVTISFTITLLPHMAHLEPLVVPYPFFPGNCPVYRSSYFGTIQIQTQFSATH